MHTFPLKSGDCRKYVCTVHAPNEKDAMTSGCLAGRKYEAPSGECTVLRTGQPVETQDVFFWRLAGRSAPTGLAIVHWIGCINAIKHIFLSKYSLPK